MMSRTLRLSDGSLARALEAGRGEPLLLLHGVGLRAEAWGPQIGALSTLARVAAVDLPGHGDTDHLAPPAAVPALSDAVAASGAGDRPHRRAPSPLGGEGRGEGGSAPATGPVPRLPDFVAWAARVVAALDLGPVNLAGHSMGALIALGLAVEYPDLVRRVALLNGVHRRDAASRAAVLARADDIAAGRGGAEGPLSRWFGPGDAAPRAQVAGWLAQVAPQGYATAYRAFAEGDGVYADRLGDIACPFLALTGDGDANSTPAMARAMAALAPQGRAVVIAGHRHMVNLTAADKVTHALKDWLATQGAPA
ncbi:MAG: alpha/beta fold hydrolase [Gemmobacter sp.]